AALPGSVPIARLATIEHGMARPATVAVERREAAPPDRPPPVAPIQLAFLFRWGAVNERQLAEPRRPPHSGVRFPLGGGKRTPVPRESIRTAGTGPRPGRTRRRGPAAPQPGPFRKNNDLDVSLRADVALELEVEDDLLGRLLGGQLLGADHHLGVVRLFVGVGDAGELLDDPGPGLGVEALAVAGLAGLERRGHVDEDEPAAFLDHVPHVLAGLVVGGDGGADGDAAVLGDLGGDVADPADVDVAVLLGEAELRRQVLAD